MKKILGIVTILTLLIYSCKKEEKENDASTNTVVGTWLIQSITGDGQTKDLDSCSRQNYFVLSDKTFKVIDFDIEQNGTCVEEIKEGSYIISGNQLIMTSGIEKEIKFFTLEGDTLILTESYKENNNTIIEVTVYRRK